MLNVDRSNPIEREKLTMYKIKEIAVDEKEWNSEHRVYIVGTSYKIRRLLNKEYFNY